MPIITIDVRDGSRIKTIDVELPAELRLEVNETEGDYAVRYGHENNLFDAKNVISVTGKKASQSEIEAACNNIMKDANADDFVKAEAKAFLDAAVKAKAK